MNIKAYETKNEKIFVIDGIVEVRIPLKAYDFLKKRFSDEEIASHGEPRELKHHVTGRRLYYIHEKTGIPLIGHTAFGIIDRGTNLIQVRPISGCNLNCIFCSVDEGKSKTRVTDYIVHASYLTSIFEEVAEFKRKHSPNVKIEAHIDGQGEPFLYPKIDELIRKLSQRADIVSVQTSGMLLSQERIKKLENYLDRINLSIHTLDEKKGKILSGTTAYDVDYVKEICKEIANSNIDLLLAPVWIPGYNDDDIKEIINFGRKIGAGKKWKPFGIQKYVKYKFGRKPKDVKAMSYKHFYSCLSSMGEELRLFPKDFGIVKCKSIPKKFDVEERVDLKLCLYGRMEREMIAVGRGRVIQVVNTEHKPNDFVKAKIVRNRHNIYVAKIRD